MRIILYILLTISLCFSCNCNKSKQDTDLSNITDSLHDEIRDSIEIMNREILFGSFTEDGLCNPWITESFIRRYNCFLERQMDKLEGMTDSVSESLLTYLHDREDEVLRHKGEIEELAWKEDSISCNGINMSYRTCVTNPNTIGKSWLVLVLHGKMPLGENPMHIGQGHKCIRHYMDIKGKRCIMLYPISPNRSDWTAYSDLLMRLIERYSKDTDMSRLYIVGESNGAVGVWRMVNKYPDLFAGAMPVALDVPNCVADYPHLRVCITQEVGKNGNVKALSFCTDNNKRFDSVGENHGDCIQKSFTTERLDWLFSDK